MNINYQFESELKKYVTKFSANVSIKTDGAVQVSQGNTTMELKVNVSNLSPAPMYQR